MAVDLEICFRKTAEYHQFRRQDRGCFDIMVPDLSDVLPSSYRIVGYASPVINMGQIHGWHRPFY